MVERINKKEGRLLAQDEYKRAKEELKASRLLHKNGIYFKSIVSSYYAVYHAVKALLLLKGVITRSHEGAERMFSLYYVKTGEVDVKIGKIIGRLMKLREEADYYPEMSFTEEDSLEAIKEAETFLKNIEKFFNK